MMASGAQPAGHRLVEVVGQAVAVAVDDALLEALLDGPARCGPPSPPPLAVAPSNSSIRSVQRVVAVAAAVVDRGRGRSRPAPRGAG